MDEAAFQQYLKRGGRAEHVRVKVIQLVQDFANYLEQHRGGTQLDTASTEDLESFTTWLETEPRHSAKMHLWAIRYYYHFIGNEALQQRAGALREARMTRTRKPFLIRKFRDVDPEHAAKLAAIGIKDVAQMRAAGKTTQARAELAEKAGVPLAAIIELVKLSDLARIEGIKGIRARLYYDAGVDTLDKLAQWNPAELRAMLQAFVERTGFDGIAPLSKEARHAVAKAKELPRIVEY
jgi:predicted flap endonuclease-1-like 5' DNA nuclease